MDRPLPSPPGPDTAGSRRFESVLRHGSGTAARSDEDQVVVEEPLEIRVRGRSVTVTMRTPGHDAELAAGFLLAEGVLRRRTDLLEIAPCAQAPATARGNVVNAPVAACAGRPPWKRSCKPTAGWRTGCGWRPRF